MKKNYLRSLLLLCCITGFAQNSNKLVEGQPRQEVMTFTKAVDVQSSINQFKSKYRLDDNTTFSNYSKNVDKLNQTHEKYQQYYKGLKVEFGTVILHHYSGVVGMVNGELYDPKNVSITPSLSKEVSFNYAKNFIGADAYLWEDRAQAELMDYTKPEGELLLFPNVKTGEVNLAYKYDIYATQPISRKEVYVEANTGEVLYVNPIIKHADRVVSKREQSKLNKVFENAILFAPGSAATRYSGNQTIETTAVGPNFALLDNTRGDGINTYDCQRGNQYQNVNFLDNDNNWTAGEHDNVNKDNGAIDAHWGAQITYDFWDTFFNRNSFDDNGSAINSYVHYDDNPGGAGYDNAFWNGQVMTYGDGNGFDILTSLDVCGHEVGHAVCTFTANLAYQNQSGAMNEGFSDIWGACIEQYGRTGSLSGAINNDIWRIGEDITASGFGLRSMQNPNPYGDPDTYLGNNWRETGDEGSCVPAGNSNDHCGVHSNSGVLNHWFYILTAGDSGTNNAPTPDTYSVTGIGMDKSAEIAYLLERDYLSANSTLADARNFSIVVASSLYCPASPEVIAVTNSWYAVNVGEEFANVAKDVAMATLPENLIVDCSTSVNPDITFYNGGTTNLTSVDISYSLDGGAVVNETWTGNLSICSEGTYTLNLGTLSRGVHTLNVTTNTVNDGRLANNSKSSTIIVNDSGAVNTINGFNDDLVAFNKGETSSMWERGTASGTLLSNAAAQNSTVYATNLSGLHADDTIAYLVTQCYDLSSLSTAILTFDMAFDIEENWDILYMEYSNNGGQDWNVLGSSTDPDWYNSNRLPDGSDCFNCIGSQWTGEGEDASSHSSGGANRVMHQFEYNLAAFTSESNMIFRFVYRADDAYAEEGAIIDNFSISGTLGVDDTKINETEIKVFPNPTNGLVTITNIGSDVSIDIIDIRGRTISSNTNYTVNSKNVTLDVSELSTGAYFLVVKGRDNKIVKQLIKE